MKDFYVKVGKRKHGPLTINELKKLIHQGSFCEEDVLWDATEATWKEAKTVAACKELFQDKKPQPDSREPKIFAIASGKGGVGKTVLTGSIGVGLASMGQDVILVDADFGGANLHTSLGILEPKFTFFDFYTLQKETLNEIVLQTLVNRLQLISGSCGTLGLANPKYVHKQRFIKELKTLNADTVILDLGAGSSRSIIDFFLLADEKILVITPEPTSVYEAFGFIKTCLMRKFKLAFKKHKSIGQFLAQEEINKPGKTALTMKEIIEQIATIDPSAVSVATNILQNFTPRIILNMVRTKEDLLEGKAIQTAFIELLSVRTEYLGYISYDANVSCAVKNMQPLLLHNARTQAAQDLSKLIRVNLLGKKGIKHLLEKRRWNKQLENVSRDYSQTGSQTQQPICSIDCFYWSNCDFQDGGKPCRVRHIEPVLKEQRIEKPSEVVT